jgi:hypothetical protein
MPDGAGEAFTLLTTDPSPDVAPIHDRQGVYPDGITSFGMIQAASDAGGIAGPAHDDIFDYSASILHPHSYYCPKQLQFLFSPQKQIIPSPSSRRHTLLRLLGSAQFTPVDREGEISSRRSSNSSWVIPNFSRMYPSKSGIGLYPRANASSAVLGK